MRGDLKKIVFYNKKAKINRKTAVYQLGDIRLQVVHLKKHVTVGYMCSTLEELGGVANTNQYCLKMETFTGSCKCKGSNY